MRTVVYTCDGKDENGKLCGLILVPPNTGIVLQGTMLTSDAMHQTVIAESSDDGTAFCHTCLKRLIEGKRT